MLMEITTLFVSNLPILYVGDIFFNILWLRASSSPSVPVMTDVRTFPPLTPPPQMLVVMAPLASDEELRYMNTLTGAKNMTLAYSKSNMHIYLPQGEVII